MMKKADIINGAYSQMRISGLTVDPSPDDVATALERLEDMAAEWYSLRNVRANYRFEDEPDPNTESGIERGHKQAFETNLAVLLIPDFNKEVPAVLIRRASATYSALSGASFPLREVAYPSRQPIGSGNNFRGRQYRRYYPGGDSVDLSATSTKDADAIEGYSVNWDWWLLPDGNLVSSEWFIETGDDKLILSGSTFDQYQTTITMSGGTIGAVYRVTNRVGSSTGRKNDYSIYIRIV